jgi:hypothetical protein
MTPHSNPLRRSIADVLPIGDVTGAGLESHTRPASFYSPAELWLQRANAAHTAAMSAFRGNPSHRNRQRVTDACLERVNAYNRTVLAGWVLL